jgi:ribosomal protein L16/L10AE
VLLDNVVLYYNQVFSLFKILRKYFKKRVKIKFNLSLFYPYTKKSVTSRMGKGKGPRRGFKTVLKKGLIIVEFGNVSDLEAFLVFNQCKCKLPVNVKLIKLKV